MFYSLRRHPQPCSTHNHSGGHLSSQSRRSSPALTLGAASVSCALRFFITSIMIRPTTSKAAFAAPVPLVPRVTTQLRIAPLRPPQCPLRKTPTILPPHRQSQSICMSAAAAELRRRIESVKSAEKIVSALRLVAAARIRSTSVAALRARPFAEELQRVLAALVRHITARRIDVSAVAGDTPVAGLTCVHGPLLAEPTVQRALLDSIYLVVEPGPPIPPKAALPLKSSSHVTLLVVVAADRKFCGSYNKEVLTRATARLRALQTAGESVELLLLGRIAQLHFSRTEPDISVRWSAPLGPLSGLEGVSSALSNELLSNFVAGGVCRIEVIYTRFLSLIATAPSSRTLLPLTPTGIESIGDEVFNLSVTSRAGRVVQTQLPMEENVNTVNGTTRDATNQTEQILCTVTDEQAVELLNSMIPLFVSNQVMRIVRESVASEQASRLAAMTAATDNARELVTTLRTQFNKQRQAKITNEIIEVVSNVRV